MPSVACPVVPAPHQTLLGLVLICAIGSKYWDAPSAVLTMLFSPQQAARD